MLTSRFVIDPHLKCHFNARNRDDAVNEMYFQYINYEWTNGERYGERKYMIITILVNYFCLEPTVNGLAMRTSLSEKALTSKIVKTNKKCIFQHF